VEIYTADRLIEDVQDLAALPTDDERFTDSKILKLADQVTLSRILPDVKRHRGAWLSFDSDNALIATGRYRIPPRAVMGGLIDVKLISGSSSEQEEDVEIIEEKDVRNRTLSIGWKKAAFLKGNSVYTLPQSISGYTYLRLTYMLRPSRLVTVAEAAEITAINTGTNTVTCTSVPTSFSGETIDIVRALPQAEVLALDQSPIIVTGTSGTLQFSSLPTDLEVGDYCTIAGESPIVLLPRELSAILAQETANLCLQLLHDTTGKRGQELEKELREGASILLTPRVENGPKRLVPRHGIVRRR
jgi:hypothetical protein